MTRCPGLGDVVIYRSRTGDYDVPAVVTATIETLNPKGVELGYIPALSGADHVHLTCLTAGKPGLRRDARDFLVESAHPRSENVAGCYQEWDIPFALVVDPHCTAPPRAGTWRWPTPIPPSALDLDALTKEISRRIGRRTSLLRGQDSPLDGDQDGSTRTETQGERSESPSTKAPS